MQFTTEDITINIIFLQQIRNFSCIIYIYILYICSRLLYIRDLKWPSVITKTPLDQLDCSHYTSIELKL